MEEAEAGNERVSRNQDGARQTEESGRFEEELV